jgi:hypothetical protein
MKKPYKEYAQQIVEYFTTVGDDDLLDKEKKPQATVLYLPLVSTSIHGGSLYVFFTSKRRLLPHYGHCIGEPPEPYAYHDHLFHSATSPWSPTTAGCRS